MNNYLLDTKSLENNIKLHLKLRGLLNVEWTKLAQDTVLSWKKDTEA